LLIISAELLLADVGHNPFGHNRVGHNP